MDIIIQTKKRLAPSLKALFNGDGVIKEIYIKEGQGRNIHTFTGGVRGLAMHHWTLPCKSYTRNLITDLKEHHCSISKGKIQHLLCQLCKISIDSFQVVLIPSIIRSGDEFTNFTRSS